LLETALKLNPDSAITRIEYANALVMMFGKAKMKDAERLYQEAAPACRWTPWSGSTSKRRKPNLPTEHLPCRLPGPTTDR
jgi:hypothetical protein